MTIKKRIALLLSMIMIVSVVGTVPTTAHAATWDIEKNYRDSILEFSSFDYSDTQYFPDEKFFGKWNAETGDWEEGFEPVFNYEAFTELREVSDAAKDSDYETCKKEIREYYKKKHAGYNITVPEKSDISARSRARYESGLDNVFPSYDNVVSGRAVFDRSWGETKIEVHEDLTDLAKSTGAVKRLKYLIMAAKKDGYRLEIAKGGQHAPYISAVVNGEPMTVPLSAATYVDGSSPDEAKGNESILLVEESVSSIGKRKGIDENTKRAMIQFDFDSSRINSDAKVTSATLHLWGRMVEDELDEEPTHILETPSVKSAYLFDYKNVTEVDPSLTFNQYISISPHGYNFNGESYPQKWRSANIINNITEGYLKTGEEAFAYAANRLFAGNCLFFGDYDSIVKNTKLGVYDTLAISEEVFSNFPHVHRLIQSESLTDETFTLILKHFYNAARFMVEHWSYAEETINWGGYSVSGLLYIVFAFNEFKAVEGPLNLDVSGNPVLTDNTLKGSVTGGWREVAKYRHAFKSSADSFDDGSSVEGSISYTLEGLANFLYPKQRGETFNIDYSDFYEDPEIMEHIKKVLRYIVANLTPQFGEFQVGDCGEWNTNYSALLEKYAEVIDDEFLKYVVTKRREGTEPSFKSVAYDGAKTAVFRNSWADNNAIAAIFLARGGGSHNHNDDLSITLGAYGQHLLTDARMGTYNTDDPGERWVSSSRAHNTVEIDRTVMRGYRDYGFQMDPIVFETDENGDPKVQDGLPMVDDVMRVPLHQLAYRPGNLFPENREINDVYDFMRGETLGYNKNQALNGEDFKVTRDVLFLRSGYFVVTDYMKPGYSDIYPDNVHHYKQHWHFLPNANMSVDEEANTARTNFRGSANIIVAAVDADPSENEEAVNNNDIKPVTRYGIYAAERSMFEPCKYVAFEQEGKGTVTFNTILYPMPEGKDAKIETKKLSLALPWDEANAFSATITDTTLNEKTDIRYYTLLDETKKKDIDFGDFKTDGVLALSERKEHKNINAVLRRGRYLKDELNDEYIIYSEEEIEDIGVSWQNDEIDVAYNVEDEYNPEIDFDKLTIKANGKAKTVRINGEKVDFKQKGRYVYFGEEPIFDDEDILPEPDEDDDESGFSGSHGTTGGSSSGGNSGNSASGSSGGPAGSGSNGSGSGGSGGGGGNSGKEDIDEKPEVKPVTPKPSDEYKSELKSHWAESEITQLVDEEIVQGFGDGTLGLDRNITRAQFITMLVRALGTEIKSYNDSFEDVSEGSWYADYIETAVQNGWIQGDGKNSYPDRNITREEITKIIVAAFEQRNGEINIENSNSFTDGNSISSWAEESVNKAVSTGLINGMGNGEFQPKESAKREQAMVLIYRVLEKLK